MTTSVIAEKGELLERESELAVLAGALTAVTAASAGALAMVYGEAGVGKTALLHRFCHERADGIRVLWGACESLFTPRPLGPFRDVADDLGGDLRALVAGGGLPHEVASSLVRKLDSETTTILVIEDAHWADEATLDVLRLLSRRLDAAAGARRGHVPRRRARADASAANRPRRARSDAGDRRGPLSRRSPRRRSRSSPRASRRRGGAVRAGRAGIRSSSARCSRRPARSCPNSVRDAVFARAARLEPQARDLLDAVAVVPPRRELWLLEAIAGDAVGALDECLGVGHARVRASTRRVPARAGATRGRGLDQPAQPGRAAPGRAAALRGHARRPPGSGARSRTMPRRRETRPRCSSSRRGRGARRRGRRASRGGGAVRARSALRRRPRRRATRAELFDRRAYACYLIGEFDAAIEAEQEAVECFRRAGDRRGEGDALRSLSRLLRYVGRERRGDGRRHQAVAILESAAAGTRARARIRQPLPPPPASRGRRGDGGVGEPRHRARRRRGGGLRAARTSPTRSSRRASGDAASSSERSSSRSRRARRARRARARRLVLVVARGRRVRATRTATSTARSSAAPSAASSCGGCSPSRAARACSSTAATGATPRIPRASFSAIHAARRCRGSSRCPWPGSCVRGAGTRRPGRCSTRRGRSPSRPASCSGSSRPQPRGRRPPGSRADTDAVAEATEGRARAGPAPARSVDRRRARCAGVGVPALRDGAAARGAGPVGRRAERRRCGAPPSAGPNSTRRTRPRSRSPAPTTEDRCCARSTSCSGSARVPRPRSSRAACASAAPAACRAARGPRHARTRPG